MNGVKLSALKTSDKLENEGALLEYENGLTFLVGRMGSNKNEQYKKTVDQKLQLRVANEYATEDETIDYLVDILANSILLGWDNLLDDDGKPIPFTIAKAKEILKEYKDIRGDVYAFCTNRKNYYNANIDEETANLSNALNGQ